MHINCNTPPHMYRRDCGYQARALAARSQGWTSQEFSGYHSPSNEAYIRTHTVSASPCLGSPSPAASHFQGESIIFECFNEPNGMGKENTTDITLLCNAAGASFHQTGGYFVGPATAGIDFNYLNQTFQDGILTGFDAVSVHPYRDGAPESVLDDYTTLRGLIEKYAPAGSGKEVSPP